MYAEELFFTPKYVKAKEMADQGAFGDVYLVKQSEKHFGPHGDWFWDVEQSGGGVLMDMGCHGIAFCNWFLDRPRLERVTAQGGTYVHQDKTKGDDNCIVILEFAGGKVGLVEDSWARTGGMDDRIEVFGSKGCTYGNLHMGNALPTFSEVGFGYAVEKAPTTMGWTYPVFEELWNYGFPQEMAHFARCVRGKVSPIATGEDGRFVQQVLFAAYQSMGAGQRVHMPFDAYGVKKPIESLVQSEALASSAETICRHSSSSVTRHTGFDARLYQYAALPSSPSLRCRYACTHAPVAFSISCAASCAAFQSPRPSSHNARNAGDTPAGALAARSVAVN